MPGLRPPGFGENKPNNRELETKYSLDLAHTKAVEILSKDAIKETDFADLYGAENVGRDVKEAKDLKEKFEKRYSPEERESKKLALVLEAVVHTQVNKAQWLGPHAKSLRSSEYDDFENGVDGIIEFKQPQTPANYLALAIDVTYGHNLEKKLDKIKGEINQGRLTTIKYLKSSDGTFRGERTQNPRLVLAVDGETVTSLAQSWYHNAPGLKDNVIRYQILKELTDQLALFENYAHKVGQSKAAERYAEASAVIEPLFFNTKKYFDSKNYRHELTDKAYDEMHKQLGMFI